jgi:OmpA-OmpF porin, OOP family
MPKLIVFALSICLFSFAASAQNFEIGLTLGVTSYNGDIDIKPQNLSSTLRPSIGVLGKYRFRNGVKLRGQVQTGSITASEKNHSLVWRQERSFAFSSPLTEAGAFIEIPVFEKNRITFYAFGGITATFFNPRTDFNTPNPFLATDINPDAVAAYSKVTPAIPIGIGATFALRNNFNLSLEGGYRKVFTDYLDGISLVGNPDRPDAYFIGNIILTKSFGRGNNGYSGGGSNKDAACPKF